MTTAPPAASPLAGITVLALEQAIAAPLCTRHLADLGARAIKVEQPGTGDASRHYDGVVRGLAAHFVWLNHGKQSAALDLTEPSDRNVFIADIGTALYAYFSVLAALYERERTGRGAVIPV